MYAGSQFYSAVTMCLTIAGLMCLGGATVMQTEEGVYALARRVLSARDWILLGVSLTDCNEDFSGKTKFWWRLGYILVDNFICNISLVFFFCWSSSLVSRIANWNAVWWSCDLVMWKYGKSCDSVMWLWPPVSPHQRLLTITHTVCNNAELCENQIFQDHSDSVEQRCVSDES